MNPLAQDLGGVVRLLEKATPGEWRVSGECVIFDDRRLVCCGRGRYECCGDPDVYGAEHPIVGLLGGNPNISDVETIAAAVNFLRTHSAEIAGALRDAERYRWLKENCQHVPDELGVAGQLYFGTYAGGELDAAIDAARAGERG